MSAEWVSAHLFHGGDLDGLVTGLVAPVTRQAAAEGLATDSFFIRYWEGGLHVRLRLRPSDPRAAAQLRTIVTARAGDYFEANPSTWTLTEQQYRSFAAGAGRGERLARYDTTLYPCDTVRFVDYLAEHQAYGDDACIAAVERHFVESSRIAIGALSAGVPMSRRAAFALAALTVTMSACDPDLDAVEARATAVGAGRATAHPAADPGSGTGPGGADPGSGTGAGGADVGLRRQTRRLWRAGHDPAGALGEWSRSIRRLHDELADRYMDAAATPPDAGSPMGFLAAVLGERRRAAGMVLLRCAHLLNNRLGLSLVGESQVARLLVTALSQPSGEANRGTS